jgi:hypothetical protein
MMALVLLLIVMFTSATSAVPKRRIRVLFDEGHNQWWITNRTKAYESDPDHPEWHNYWDLKQRLEIDGFIIDSTENPITLENIRSYDVVVIPPTCGNTMWWNISARPFSNTEIGAIQNYVLEGGGLILIGHPYINQTFSNDLASTFKVAFSNCPIADDRNNVGNNLEILIQEWNLPEVLYLYNQSQSIIKEVHAVFSSQTSMLQIEKPNIPLMFSGYRSWIDTNADGVRQANETAAPRAILGSIGVHGKGRVIALGSGIIFERFDPFDNYKFVKNCIKWAAAKATASVEGGDHFLLSVTLVTIVGFSLSIFIRRIWRTIER